jgi:catechol 2,3-dioxygenase-like lactoylglutathione lyase family enzyme
MADLSLYQKRREELSRRYLQTEAPALQPVYTGGVDHLALISSDLEATIHFYTEVIGMRLTRIVQNRDEPTSTHIFLDMGGGNLLAFFDFPEKARPEPYAASAVCITLRSRRTPTDCEVSLRR